MLFYILITSPFIFLFMLHLHNSDPIWKQRIRGLISLIPKIGPGLEKFIYAKTDAEQLRKFTKMFQTVNEINETSLETKKTMCDFIKTNKEEYLEILLKEIKINISNNIVNYEFSYALKSSENVLLFLKQNKISVKYQNEFESYKGIILLKLDDMEQAKSIKENVLDFSDKTEIMIDFLILYAALTSDEAILKEQIKGYKKLGINESSINLKIMNFYYIQKRYDQIILSLCADVASGELKHEYMENKDAAFFAGLAFFELKEYPKAERLLEQSLTALQFTVHNFYLIKTQAFNIFDNKYSFLLLSTTESTLLQKLLAQLNSDMGKALFSKLPSKPKAEYWLLKLQIAFYIDENIAYNEYQSVPQEIKYDDSFRELYADILHIQGKHTLANQIFCELFSTKPNSTLLTKILDSFLADLKYQEILDFIDKVNNSLINDVNRLIVVEAYSKLNTIEDTILFANDYIKYFADLTQLYAFLGNITAKEGAIEKANEFYEKMLNALPKNEPILRIMIAKEIQSHGFQSIVLRCLEPCIEDNLEAQKMYVYNALITGDEKFICKALIIINNNLEKQPDNIDWLKWKSQIELYHKKLNSAKHTLEKLYGLNQTIEVVYNLVLLKLQLNEIEDIIGFAKTLTENTKPEFVMMGALAYYAKGDYIKSEQYSLVAIALNGNEFNEILFQQYLQINLIPRPGQSNEDVLDEVCADCVINLVKDEENIWLGISSSNELVIKENNCSFADVTFFNCKDHKILSLIGTHKGENANYEGNQYLINEVLSIKAIAIRFCFKYASQFSADGLLRQISFPTDKFLETIMPFFAEAEIYDKQILDQYNFANGIGLPLSVIATKRNTNIFDTLIYLWNKRTQAHYTGEINNIVIANQKIIISPVTICVLYSLDILQTVCFMLKDNIIIASKSKAYFAKIVNDIQNKEKSVAGSGGSDNGRLFYEEYSKEMKNKRLEYFRNLFNILNELRVEKTDIPPEELDENEDIIKMISIEDYEGVRLAEQIKGIYLSDDLFLRKYIKMKQPNSNSINSISIVELLIADSLQYLTVLVTLSSVGYMSCYDIKLLCLIYDKITIESQIIGAGSKYDMLVLIISNSLSYVQDYEQKIPTIILFIGYLYDKYNNLQSDYLIKLLIKQLYIIFSLKKINFRILGDEILKICKNKPSKMKYFKTIFNSLNIQTNSPI